MSRRRIGQEQLGFAVARLSSCHNLAPPEIFPDALRLLASQNSGGGQVLHVVSAFQVRPSFPACRLSPR